MSCGGTLTTLPTAEALSNPVAAAASHTQSEPKPVKKAFGVPVRTWGIGLGSFFGVACVAMVGAALSSSKPNSSAATESSFVSSAATPKSEHDQLMQQPIDLPPKPKPVVFNVAYVVVAEQDHRFSVTYTNAEGGTEQDNETTATEKYLTLKDGTPINKWTRRFKADPGASLYISAQSQEQHTTMLVRIYVDGDLIRDSKATGAFAIGSCDYKLPSLSD